MKSEIKILILEDNTNDADLLYRELKKSGLNFISKVVSTHDEFENALESFLPDLILSDYSLPAFDATTAFRIKQNKYPQIPFIIVSGIIGEENAVELIKEGVTDYAQKNTLFTLVPKITRALNEKKEREEKLIIAEKLKQQTIELIIANKELLIQNQEKERRTADLIAANKELLAFTYVSSHDLQEPLRKIQAFISVILKKENENLSEMGKTNFLKVSTAAGRMQQLILDLLDFSRVNTGERKFENTDLNMIIDEVKNDLNDMILEKQATIESTDLCPCNIIAFQIRQLMHNLIGNALKFSIPGNPVHILIKNKIINGRTLNSLDGNNEVGEEKFSAGKDYCHIMVKDNGIGFEPHFSKRIFEVFQKLHEKEVYAGTGIGLAIVKKIVDNHNGIITATSELKEGATFDIYIPATQ